MIKQSNVIKFTKQIVCVMCNIKTTKKESWIVFDDNISGYETQDLCLKCANKALDSLVSNGYITELKGTINF